MTGDKMPRKRLTREIINNRIADRGIVMLDEYVRQTVKARFQCDCGYVWAARPNNVLSGKGCPKCGKLAQAKKMRLSVETVRQRLADRNISLIGEYVDTQTKALFKCSHGHTWEAVPSSVMSGRGCPHCYTKNHPLEKELVNARIADRGITLVGDYMGAHISTLFRCSKNHTWLARPNNILHGKNCPHCDGQFPLSPEVVNERLAKRGLVLVGEYINSVSPTQFQCGEGHTWEAAPGNVMGGTGCPFCYDKNHPLTTEIVNERIADRGIVLLDEYVNNSTRRRFQCEEGHIWETAPASVLAGRGCNVCADRTSDNDVFYLWLAGPQKQVMLNDGEYLLKFGVTSERRDDMRIKEVAWAWGITVSLLAVVKTMGPAIWAEKAVAKIGQKLDADCAHLDGWTEFRIVNQTELAQFMAEYKIVWEDSVPHNAEYQSDQLKLDL